MKRTQILSKKFIRSVRIVNLNNQEDSVESEFSLSCSVAAISITILRLAVLPIELIKLAVVVLILVKVELI